MKVPSFLIILHISNVIKGRAALMLIFKVKRKLLVYTFLLIAPEGVNGEISLTNLAGTFQRPRSPIDKSEKALGTVRVGTGQDHRALPWSSGTNVPGRGLSLRGAQHAFVLRIRHPSRWLVLGERREGSPRHLQRHRKT